jgi:hypothetical protein
MYHMQAEKMEMELAGLSRSAPREVLVQYREKILDYRKRYEKYEQEKAEIEVAAKNLEKVRDESQLHAKAFGVAVIYLQIAILLSSIAGLLKKKPVWYVGLATGSIGLVFFANGFWLFI